VTIAPNRLRLPLRALRGAGLGLACALAAYALTAAPLARGVEDWVLDGWFFYRGPRPTAARVVVVGIDEPSLRELARPLPEISPELAAVARHALDQGAAAVGLDLLVPEYKSDEPAVNDRSGRGEAWSLGEVVRKSGRVVLPVRGIEGGALLPLRQWWQAKRLLHPEDTDFGFADLDEDGDQFVRRQRLLLGGEVEGRQVPQLALALYLKARGEPLTLDPATGAPLVGGRPAPLDAEGKLRINFAGPPEAFPVVPFRDALAAARAGRPLPADVRGAVVVVGVTARSQQDYHATPYANHYARYEAAPAPGLMAGPELHAHVLATLQDGAYVTTPAWLAPVPLLVATGLLLGLAFARLSLEAGFLLAVAHHWAWKAAAFLAFARAGYRVEVVAPLLLGALCYSATFLLRWRLLRRMFGVVKSEAVARALEADPHRLDPGGEEREVTVLFADVRRFTDFSENHTPAEVVAMLNAYFAAAVPALEAEGGTVMSYLGDGLMVLFGAPASQPDHALRAVRAAAALVRAVHAHRGAWAKLDRAGVWAGQGGLRVGVGVHTGPVVVGAVGTRRRLDYTAIGDAVNAAARIEAENKAQGTEALVSAATAARLPPGEAAGLGLSADPVEVTVKGKAEKLKVYPLAVA
jgi:adenylate cyclase